MSEFLSNKILVVGAVAVIPVAWLLTHYALIIAHQVLKNKQVLHDRSLFFNTLRAPLLAILGLIGLHTLLPALHFNDALEGEITEWFVRLYIMAGFWFVSGVVHLLKLVANAKFDISTSNNLRARKIRTQFQFLERTANVILFVVALGFVLMTFESVRRVGGSLIASAGVVGIVVGFAAQKTLGTLLAGFQVAFTQPIRIDDVVVVENYWGRIEEITLSYVVIRIWDKRRLIVPINYFTEKTFENWTRNESDLLSYCFLNFDFSLNIEQVRQQFFAALKETPLWDQGVAVVQITDADDKSMKLRFLMGAKDSAQGFDLACYVRERIFTYVQKTQPRALPYVRWPEDQTPAVLGQIRPAPGSHERPVNTGPTAPEV